MQLHLVVLSLWTLFLSHVTAQASATVTIQAYSDFAAQRQCVQVCITGWSGDINDNLHCAGPVLNTCFCRSDLQPLATKGLSGCVQNRCADNGGTPSVDLNAATSIYSAYCAGALSPNTAAPAPVTTTTTNEATPTQNANSIASTVVVTVTSTPTTITSSSTTSSGDSLSISGEFSLALLAVWTVCLCLSCA
jgi:hypothetical protein